MFTSESSAKTRGFAVNRNEKRAGRRENLAKTLSQLTYSLNRGLNRCLFLCHFFCAAAFNVAQLNVVNKLLCIVLHHGPALLTLLAENGLAIEQ